MKEWCLPLLVRLFQFNVMLRTATEPFACARRWERLMKSWPVSALLLPCMFVIYFLSVHSNENSTLQHLIIFSWFFNYFISNYRPPVISSFTTSIIDNKTTPQLNYSLVAATIQTISDNTVRNYTKYAVGWSHLAKQKNHLLFRINIWTYSFILKLVPSIILTVITGFLIKGVNFYCNQTHMLLSLNFKITFQSNNFYQITFISSL